MGSELYKIKMNEDIEKFEINRRTFENESELCSLIRNDLIDDFIFYVHKNNISLETPIKRSIFETNSILNEKEPTLIEYAFFFGSIQIIKYLEINDVSLKPSMWIYTVHSDNAEVIGFLEAKNIEIDERTFSEVIKCHHNSIAHYLYDKLFDNQTSIKDLSFEPILNIYSSNNYELFSYETDCGYLFFSLIKSGYDELVEYHLKAEKNEIFDFIKQYQDDDTQKIIIKALSEKKIDAAYYLMSEYLDCIPKEYFKHESFELIALPPSIESIESSAFEECSSLKQIIIPSSVTKIGISAFSRCSLLTQIIIPSSVTEIEDCSFLYCSSLTQITIPSSVTSIGSLAFFGCLGLAQITFPSSLTLIGDSAFYDCLSLKQITIPSSVTEIGFGAFHGCSSLLQITIPPLVTQIDTNTFSKCSCLKQVSIPSSVTEIAISAFEECSFFCNFNRRTCFRKCLFILYGKRSLFRINF